MEKGDPGSYKECRMERETKGGGTQYKRGIKRGEVEGED